MLSPTVYELPRDKAKDLAILGKDINRCFQGLAKMAVEAPNPQRGHSAAWRIIRAVLSNGISKVYRPLQQLNPDQRSAIIKVDLMEDTNGRLWVAEIDGYNPRGMGYSTLGSRLAGEISSAPRLPGVAATLARMLSSRQQYFITFLYSDRERFYLPEITIFKEEMAKNGIMVNVVSEMDFCFNDDGQEEIVFVIFPELSKNSQLSKELSRRYQNGTISFLIPPKPYQGSKAVLALLKNQEENEEIEQILQEYIPVEALAYVRAYTPDTYLAGKPGSKLRDCGLNLCGWKTILEAGEGQKYVLKRTVSSGMKGVFFSDDAGYSNAIAEAEQCQAHFILQAEVETLGRNMQYYISPEELITSFATWHSRLTTYYIGDELADIVVTARRDKRVHGSVDCVQLGTILV
jgi:hypothetical protein